jgi:hypothetical protein
VAANDVAVEVLREDLDERFHITLGGAEICTSCRLLFKVVAARGLPLLKTKASVQVAKSGGPTRT